MPSYVEILRCRGAVVLRIRGPLVFGNGAGQLRELAHRALASGHDLALDLTRVSRMDAHGIGVLAELCAAAREARRLVFLAGASDRARRLLRITRLESFLNDVELPVMRTRIAAPRVSTANAR